MKGITLEAWNDKYIRGPIQRFDQKNHMYKRPMWDPNIKKAVQDWSYLGGAKEKVGNRPEEMGLRRAADHVFHMLELVNYSKPNPTFAAESVIAAIKNLAPEELEGNLPMGRKVDTDDPGRVTQIIKKVARFFGAQLVGICRLDRRWVYSHTYDSRSYPPHIQEESIVRHKPQELGEEFQYAIIMGFEMDYFVYRHYSSAISTAATGMGYAHMAFTNAGVAAYIRNLGFKAIDGTTNDVALTIPMAMQAGLGDIGRNGMLITPQFGPRLRLSKVITDLPLLPDSPIDFGVTEFCTKCEKCADMCPSKSVMAGERTSQARNISNSSNEYKWPVDAETCRIYWAKAKKGGGCTMCISVCPYNKPNSLLHRTVFWMTDHARWGDGLYKKMDDILGYARPRKPENFWEEWEPG
ncbi:MAG: reductive dehalogenase, partial [Chloroflexi bacterium]|nr:reductive dehalogenase [Chloroflexota bacterium]